MRISSIDFIRTLAIFSVILIHTSPFKTYNTELTNYLAVLINQGARFAVPFFFIVSGYFLGKKICAIVDPNVFFYAFAKRILLIFVAWSLIYLLVPNNIEAFSSYGVKAFIQVPYWRWLTIINEPLRTIFQGTKIHLWFLISLLCALLVSLVALKLSQKMLIAIALLLYLFGLMAGAYAKTPLGMPIDFNTRNGPFFSTIFFVVGLLLAKYPSFFSLKSAVLLVIGGFLLHMLEVYFLWRLYEINPMSQDYVFGTLPFGVGMAAIALSRSKLGEKTFIARYGVYTLGIYVVHYIYVDLLSSLGPRFNHIAWDFAFPVIVYGLSLITTIFISNFNFFKKIVM